MDNNKVYLIYKNGLDKYLDSVIDFSKYNQKVVDSNLYFGVSKSMKKNINTDFYSSLTKLFIDNLSDEYKNILNTKEQVDDDVLQIVEKTYKNIITSNGKKGIMYSPPLPEHYVENGSLVFEFSYGKNIVDIKDTYYTDFVLQQEKFIEELNEELKKEIKEKLDVNCVIFIAKKI